jgi:hypothetical protein
VCRSNRSAVADAAIGVCIPAFCSDPNATEWNAPQPMRIQSVGRSAAASASRSCLGAPGWPRFSLSIRREGRKRRRLGRQGGCDDPQDRRSASPSRRAPGAADSQAEGERGRTDGSRCGDDATDDVSMAERLQRRCDRRRRISAMRCACRLRAK